MNRFTRSRIQWLIIALLGLSALSAVFVVSSPSAFSAPQVVTRYVVTTGDNTGNNCTNPASPCRTIQWAVDVASSGDVISIGSGIYYENVVVDASLTLQGQGATTTIVDGNRSGSVLIVSGGSVTVSKLTLQNGYSNLGGGISIDSGVVVSVSDSNIVGNTANQGGAGIYNQGRLSLVNILLRNNLGSAGGNTTGGGIYNSGEANLSSVSILGNAATYGGGIGNINLITLTNSFVGGAGASNQNQSTGGGGGGIYNFGVSNNSTVILNNSSVVGNRVADNKGGGIYNTSILIASNAIITGNVATFDGGGIYSGPNGQVTLNGGSIVSNTSLASNGGGIYNAGAVVIDNALFNTNQAGSGGGMFNAAGGKLSANDTTVSNNTASGSPGGGINSQGILTLTKSAVIYNAANSAQGGGLYITGTAQLNNVTISDNTATGGGGLFNEGNGLKISFSTIYSNSGVSAIHTTRPTVVISSSILAQNSGAVCQEALTSGGYNIDRGTSCGLTGTGDLQNTDPKLKTLQNNGGASPTRAIDFSSAAVDSIPINVCSLNVDQRSVARPQSTGCDRGAYEVVGYSNFVGRGFGSGECVTDQITITEKLAIGQVLVGVNVAATDRNTLRATFISPSNRQVILLNTGQGSGANLDTLFDDTAAASLTGGDQDPNSPFYDNVYRPSAPLSQMNGLPIRGTWKLQVCSTGTSGTFNRWAIIVPELTNFKVRLPIVRK